MISVYDLFMASGVHKALKFKNAVWVSSITADERGLGWLKNKRVNKFYNRSSSRRRGRWGLLKNKNREQVL